MSWQNELDQLLSTLGVQQEYPQPEQVCPAQDPDLCFTQVSHSHPGVFYRLELTGSTPELRVFVPTNDGPLKVHIYLVRLSPESFLANLFGLFMTYQGGSTAFQEVEGVTIFHLFQTMVETMKSLFWQADLTALHFPPEIEVQCLQ